MTAAIGSAFAVVAAVLLLTRLGLFVALHLTERRYSFVHHAVSDYGVGESHVLFRWMGVVGAAGWLALAAAVLLGQHAWSDSLAVGIALIVLAVTVLAVMVFPTDLEGERLTRTGVLHYVAAIAQFAILYALTGNFVRLAGHDEGLMPFAGILTVLQWVVLAALIGVVVTLVPRWRRSFGLFERAFLLSTLAFYLVVAIGLAR